VANLTIQAKYVSPTPVTIVTKICKYAHYSVSQKKSPPQGVLTFLIFLTNG